MIKYLLLLLCVVLFCSFFWNDMSKESKIVHKIVREVSDKYENKYKLNFVGIALSAPRGIYRNIGISFDYYGIMSKDEVRQILVESATDLIEKINENKELRPHLRNYPFTGNDVTVTIFLNTKEGKSFYYPEMTIASFHRETLKYKYHTPNTEGKGRYFLEEKESLEEARQILEQQAQ